MSFTKLYSVEVKAGTPLGKLLEENLYYIAADSPGKAERIVKEFTNNEILEIKIVFDRIFCIEKEEL